jgi:zinc/manganese transport system substrate-binding protein
MKPFWLFLLSTSAAFSQVKTVTLHPLLTDLLQQIGGDKIQNLDLIGETGDPHHFEPSADQLRATTGRQLYFLSGKGLESYMPSLRNLVKAPARIIEVGQSLPSMEGSGTTCDHEHGHEHEHEAEIDPHWWHSIENFRRAARVVEKELSASDAQNAAYYQTRADAYIASLEELDRWARREIAGIPKARRQLATAHDAFAYFCKDYGFTAYPVQGINREQVPDAKKLAALINELKAHKVAAIFPEKESNPKILMAITKDTGIQLGDPLSADGTNVKSYEQMIRKNVTAIVRGLKP